MVVRSSKEMEMEGGKKIPIRIKTDRYKDRVEFIKTETEDGIPIHLGNVF